MQASTGATSAVCALHVQVNYRYVPGNSWFALTVLNQPSQARILHRLSRFFFKG